MRDMKFRCYDKKLKQWVVEGFHIFGEVTLFNIIGQHCYETKGEDDSLSRYNDMEVTQWTGLWDATKWEELTEGEREKWTREGNMPNEWKGKMVWEGDIVRHSRFVSSQLMKAQVTFRNGSFILEPGFKVLEDYIGNSINLRVIGSIYDNPELLNK